MKNRPNTVKICKINAISSVIDTLFTPADANREKKITLKRKNPLPIFTKL